MHPIRRRKMKLILGSISLLSVIVLLTLYALRQNISLFYSPSELVSGKAPLAHSIRIGGMVKEGSVLRGDDLTVHFLVTDYQHDVLVTYQGILPDLFREGKGVVAQGVWLGRDQFQAQTVLAKHDENYMPPEVRAALASAKAMDS